MGIEGIEGGIVVLSTLATRTCRTKNFVLPLEVSPL